MSPIGIHSLVNGLKDAMSLPLFLVLCILASSIDKINAAVGSNRQNRVRASERSFFFLFDFFDNNNNIDQSCECGVANTMKIVGGTETLVNEFPWMVFLQITAADTNTYTCGGVLITDRHILTAGHCGVPGLMGTIDITLGDHNRFITDTPAPIVKRIAEDIDIHPLYNIFAKLNYDFAILTMDSPVPFANNIRPICLPTRPRDYTNQPAVVIGYGRQAAGDAPASPVPLKANVTVASRGACLQAYRNVADTRITSAMMCAGSPMSTEDACEGDSGGPLMYRDATGTYNSIGVISFGTECGTPGTLSVHARVDRVLKWIRENTILGRYCSRP